MSAAVVDPQPANADAGAGVRDSATDDDKVRMMHQLEASEQRAIEAELSCAQAIDELNKSECVLNTS